jgi:hypothetical protein
MYESSAVLLRQWFADLAAECLLIVVSCIQVYAVYEFLAALLVLAVPFEFGIGGLKYLLAPACEYLEVYASDKAIWMTRREEVILSITVWCEGVWQFIVRTIIYTDAIDLVAFIASFVHCGDYIAASEAEVEDVIVAGIVDTYHRVYQCQSTGVRRVVDAILDRIECTGVGEVLPGQIIDVIESILCRHCTVIGDSDHRWAWWYGVDRHAAFDL